MFNLYKVNSCDGKHNDTLDVRFTKICDNDCEFCIDKYDLNNQSDDIKKLIETTLLLKKENIAILGGEPFLKVNNLIKYIKSIRNITKNIYITTSLPNTINLNDNNIKFILDNIDGLNISLQDINWERNNQILQATSKHNRIDLLKDLVLEYPEIIRVSINIMRNGIDTKSKLLKAINFLIDIGIKNIKINELVKVSGNLYISFEEIMNIKLKSAYLFGCEIDVSSIFNTDMKIQLKRTCFKLKPKYISKPSMLENWKFYIKKRFNLKSDRIVLYENGEYYNGWQQGK